MIYGGYGDHCADRAVMSTVIECLAYHLKLDLLGQMVKKNRTQ